MNRKLRISLLVTALFIVIAPPGHARDARSISLGGSAIAAGAGVHGIFENPSTLKRLQRDGQRIHLHLGASVDIRDNGDMAETLIDEKDLAIDIEREIDQISGQTVTCNPFDTNLNETCLTDTQELGSLSSRVLTVFDKIDGESIDGQASGDLGLAITHTTFPFAIHLRTVVTGAGEPTVADSDRENVQQFVDALSDGDLTEHDIVDSFTLDIDLSNQTLTVAQPEDVLTSSIATSVLLRNQIGFSLAHSLGIGGFDVDLGVTPKFSTLRVANIDTLIRDTFDETAESLTDQFENSEVEESSFTMDLGATTSVANTPLRIAAVIRNLIPESIQTETGFKFETTPQLIIGGAFDLAIVQITADLALNSAKVDNFETQPLSIGVEFGRSLLSLRGGISHDIARETDQTALSLGFGLGPLQVGGRVASLTAAQFGAQLSFSF